MDLPPFLQGFFVPMCSSLAEKVKEEISSLRDPLSFLPGYLCPWEIVHATYGHIISSLYIYLCPSHICRIYQLYHALVVYSFTLTLPLTAALQYVLIL